MSPESLKSLLSELIEQGIPAPALEFDPSSSRFAPDVRILVPGMPSLHVRGYSRRHVRVEQLFREVEAGAGLTDSTPILATQRMGDPWVAHIALGDLAQLIALARGD